MTVRASLANPIRRLKYDGAEPDVFCPVKAVPMTLGHAWYWHRHVQPLVNDQYVSATAGNVRLDPHAGVRADVGWNWPLYYAMAGTTNRLKQGAERAVAWTIVAEVSEGWVPVGMLTSVPAYASPYPGDHSKLAFVWYLSNAPREHLDRVGLPPLLGVAYMLVDVAIQTRLDLGGDASIFLHADPAGGEKLVEFYERKCRMARLWNEKRISLVRKVEPGQYFAMANEQARDFCARFDKYRGDQTSQEG
ncbi:hypothetical protein OH764_33785 (plasmid) [Burkholderia sp. M6-3]